MINRRVLINGTFSFITILLFYLIVNTLGGGFYHAIDQFRALWGYIIAIAAGFGIQISLYTHIRRSNVACNKEVAVSGTMSAGSMVACCLHHITDFIPLVGSGLSFALSAYVEIFLLIGVLSNVVSITFMLSTIQKYKMYARDGPFSYIFNTVNFRKLKYVVLVFSALFIIYYLLTYFRPESGIGDLLRIG